MGFLKFYLVHYGRYYSTTIVSSEFQESFKLLDIVGVIKFAI